MARDIPGQLGYQALAALHRPTDPAALATEIRRMASRGLRPRDISMHLDLSIASVLEALRTGPDAPSAARGDV